MVVTRVGTAPDAELVAAARAGDEGAAGELYQRHHAAVLGYARGLVRDQHTAEDLTSEAFARTLIALRRGMGPTEGYRPYLYTVVRNAAVDWARAGRRTVVTDEVAQWADSPDDDLQDVDELDALVRAFRSLPERWQTVLWHTVIEDEPVQRVAELLGMETGAVAQLSFRAREGLRQAFLAASCEGHPDCAEFTAQLAAGVRRPGRRRGRALRQHLESCDRCRRAAEEMTDLNGRLRRGLPIGFVVISAPTASIGALPTAGGAILGGWALPAGTAAAGAVVVALGIVFTQVGDAPEDSPTGAPPVALPTAGVTASPGPADGTSARLTPTGGASSTGPKKAKPSRKPGSDPVAGGAVRVRNSTLGSCLAPDGTSVVQRSCSGDTTAWRKKNVAGGFTLTSVATGKCLSRGEETSGVLWEGGAAYTVTTAPCGGQNQVWKLVESTGSVSRLVNGDGWYLQADWSGLRPPSLKPSSFAGMAAQGWSLRK